MTNVNYSSEANDSSMHWLRFFLLVFEKLDVKFTAIEPDPVELVREVLHGQKTLDDMDAVCKIWGEEFNREILARHRGQGSKGPLYDEVAAAPIMTAILVCGIRSIHNTSVEGTINQINYVGEWFETGLTRMGYDLSDCYTLWNDFRVSWKYGRLVG